MEWGNSSILKINDKVHAFFNSNNAKNKFNFQTGPIESVNALEDNDKFFRFLIPANDIDSGSPLFNMNNQIIGMVFSKFFMEKTYVQTKDSSEESSFAIKSSYLKRILNDSIKLKGSISSGLGYKESSVLTDKKIKENIVTIEMAE